MRSAPVLDDHEASDVEVPAKPARASGGLARRVGAFLLREFLEILPPTIFFLVGFNLIVLTTNLILADYGGQFASFMIATASALTAYCSLIDRPNCSSIGAKGSASSSVSANLPMLTRSPNSTIRPATRTPS
jgi:hypothetical protein